MSATLSWQKQIEKLVLFKPREGHCEVSNKYKDDPSLGRWVSIQVDKGRQGRKYEYR